MIADLKKCCFGCILPRCVQDFTTEVQNPTKQKICKLHNRLYRRHYITTLPVKPPSSNSCSVQRTVYLLIRPGLLCTLRVLADLTGTISRGRSFCPRCSNNEDTSEWKKPKQNRYSDFCSPSVLFFLVSAGLANKILNTTTSLSASPAKLISSLTAPVMHLVTLNTTNNRHGSFT